MGRAKCLTGLAKFIAGQQQLKDAARLGRPATTTTKGDIEKKRNIIKTDARFTVRQLARRTNLSLARVHEILKKHLKVRKINARWIPHLLTDEQKKTRVTMAKKNLSRCTQSIVKRLLIIKSQVMRPGCIILNQSGRLPTEHGPLKIIARRPSITKRIRTVKKVLYAIFSSYSNPGAKRQNGHRQVL